MMSIRTNLLQRNGISGVALMETGGPRDELNAMTSSAAQRSCGNNGASRLCHD